MTGAWLVFMPLKTDGIIPIELFSTYQQAKDSSALDAFGAHVMYWPFGTSWDEMGET